MAFCSKCGNEVPAGAGFCPKCGEAQAGDAAAPAAASAQPGMSENVAALLAYVFGWITGIIFLLIDKRPFVRFHAAQSIVVFGGLHLVHLSTDRGWNRDESRGQVDSFAEDVIAVSAKDALAA